MPGRRPPVRAVARGARTAFRRLSRDHQGVTPSSGLLPDLPQTGEAVRHDVLLSGVEAIVQIPMVQHRLDAVAGLRTATVVSGYPGSPLGTLDLALGRHATALGEHEVTHVPGVNEELAAATVWGSQQRSIMSASEFDGVVGIWYGKSPGVDRCGDVFKHANSMGSARNGGVLVVAGDDPSAKSSTLPNDSRGAFFDAHIPVLAPSTVEEVLQFGIHGIALSRYSGLWTGLKVVTNLADGFTSVALEDLIGSPVIPRLEIAGVLYEHHQQSVVNNIVSIQQEDEILNGRMEAARAYSLANGLNRVTHPSRDAWLGIAAVGKTHADVVQALADLGLDERELERRGVRILKIGMPFPLEPEAVREFAAGLDEILVVEEKRPLVEMFVRDVLYGSAHHPQVTGKRDAENRILVPGDGELTPERLRPVLGAVLSQRIAGLELRGPGDAIRAAPDVNMLELPLADAPPPPRTPAYCSGCPHNRSTLGPDGKAIIGSGVGCHAMTFIDGRHNDEDRDHTILPLTPMGAEGVMWIGAHQFADAPHMFQNLGDGTLAHSGSLAIRACVAANVNITFKILYNRAVAMTGGQHVAGTTEVPALTRELDAMGVSRVVVVADEPDKYGRRAKFADGVEVFHRDRLAEVERTLANAPGVTALVYDQRCAAEARRLRKRGRLPQPATRVVINEAVCEGCGDCQVKSNCLSVQPVDTPLGRKTQIHQSSCNQDLTCLQGDCPSFVTVDAETVTERRGPAVAAEPPETFPEPERTAADDTFDSYMIGVGGTGVVTVNRLLGTAAMKEGWTVVGLDQTGLSQKGGAVVSHLRARHGVAQAVSTVPPGSSDVYFAFDSLAAAEQKHLDRASPDKTLALISSAVAPTAGVITSPLTSMPPSSALGARIARSVRHAESYDAEGICEALLGDHMPAHVFLIGVAYQQGVLPFSVAAIEESIGETGGGAANNLRAFRWGRAAVVDPGVLAGAVTKEEPRRSSDRVPSADAQRAGDELLARADLPAATRAVVDWRLKDLVDYQSRATAEAYLEVVGRAVAAERPAGRTDFSEAVAHYLYRFMAYKDEYEVARLHLDAAFGEQLDGQFPGAKVAFRLHPPALRALGLKRKLAIPSWLMLPLFRMLRSMRRLRGTFADPFGRAEVRRVERRLIAEYVEMVDNLLPKLAGHYDTAVALAVLPEVVRGYEHVKLRGVEKYEAARTELLEELRA
jgi:indolepyruvate ferredoxin oxidoreductase